MSAARRRDLTLLVVAGAAAALGGCAANPAPPGFLPLAEDLPRFTHGAWAIVRHKKATDTEGELIAAEIGGLHILTRDGLRFAPATGVKSVRLALYRADGGINSVSAIGAVSTLTHGWFFPITMWFWLGPAIGESNAPLQRLPPTKVDTLRKYSRFPQGLPARLAPDALGLPAAQR